MWRRLITALVLFAQLMPITQALGCAPSKSPEPSVPSRAAVGGGPATGATSSAALAEAEKEIRAVLDDWHDAASRADEARYFGYFADAAVFLGTDATERWDVAAFRAYAHPHFARGKAWSFRAVRRAITVAPDGLHAWFDEDLDTPNMGPARGSGVLVRGAPGAPWRIAQYNLALTIPNERLDEVKALLRGPAPAPAGKP